MHLTLTPPNWDYFGSVCHLSTEDAGDKVAFQHCRQSRMRRKAEFSENRFSNFSKRFFKVTKNRAFCMWTKGQSTKETLVLSAQGQENKPPTACGEKCGCSPACTLWPMFHFRWVLWRISPVDRLVTQVLDETWKINKLLTLIVFLKMSSRWTNSPVQDRQITQNTIG